jgi:hypothetical protein
LFALFFCPILPVSQDYSGRRVQKRVVCNKFDIYVEYDRPQIPNANMKQSKTIIKIFE